MDYESPANRQETGRTAPSSADSAGRLPANPGFDSPRRLQISPQSSLCAALVRPFHRGSGRCVPPRDAVPVPALHPSLVKTGPARPRIHDQPRSSTGGGQLPGSQGWESWNSATRPYSKSWTASRHRGGPALRGHAPDCAPPAAALRSGRPRRLHGPLQPAYDLPPPAAGARRGAHRRPAARASRLGTLDPASPPRA